MKSTDSRRTASVSKYVLFTTVLLLLAVPILSQNRSLNWYFLYETAGAERGEMSELKDKRRVYLFISLLGLTGTDSIDYQRSRLEQQVSQEIVKHGGLEIVKNPEEADFAISIMSSPIILQGISSPDVERSADIKFFVLTRGTQRSDGTYVGRVIRQSRKTDRGDSNVVIRQETSAFIKDLKKVRGEK